jgi:hypothetical protein
LPEVGQHKIMYDVFVHVSFVVSFMLLSYSGQNTLPNSLIALMFTYYAHILWSLYRCLGLLTQSIPVAYCTMWMTDSSNPNSNKSMGS